MQIQVQAETFAYRVGAHQSGEYTNSWVWSGANQEPDLYLHPKEVRAYARKYNTYSPRTLSNLKRDIARDGIQQPITIATDGKKAAITDGHHRAMAADALGLDKVPVWVEHDPEMYGGRGLKPGLGEWLGNGGSPRQPGWYMDPGEA